MSGVKCKACGSRETRTTDSRPTGEASTRRRRVCACGHRFTTYEVDEPAFLLPEGLKSGALQARLQSIIAMLNEGAAS